MLSVHERAGKITILVCLNVHHKVEGSLKLYLAYKTSRKHTKAYMEPLKGLSHEEFAILGQFCAKIIT